MASVPTKRWVVPTVKTDGASHLAAQLGVPLVVAELLIQRGYDTVDKARRFLYCTPDDLYDPYLMKDMQKAVDRIRQAIDRQEAIVVYGDYDVDGVSSTALLWLGLKELGANVQYYIPDRFQEGYGLNQAALQKLSEVCSLIVTVDNGIAACREVAFANELGLDVIVTDHHNPQEELPPAYATLNPKQPGCMYPDKMLAGVGIAFKLVQALWGKIPEELSDLSALGTVADLAPLVDENRILVRMGLARMNQVRRPGLQALCDIAGLGDKDLSVGHIGFQLGPRINASGRLDSALSALDLLIARDQESCRGLAAALDQYNAERQELCDRMLAEALEILEENPELASDPMLVLGKSGWHTGVVGIVAARLVEKYYRPVVLLSYLEDGTAKGSARSISGVDLYMALADSAELYHHFGGHKMAAGLSLLQADIPELRVRLREWARQNLPPEVWIPEVRIDRYIQGSDLTEETVRGIELLGPYGFGNPLPIFALSRVTPVQIKAVGRDQTHLQLQGMHKGSSIQSIAFGRGADRAAISQCQQIDLAGELSLTEWQGKSRVQLVLRDWRPSTLQFEVIRDAVQTASWIEAHMQGKGTAVVAFSPEVLAAIRSALTGYPWQQDVHYEFLRVSDSEVEPAPTGSCESWIVTDLPRTLLQWKQFCAECPRQGKLYFLIGADQFAACRQQLNFARPAREKFALVYRTLEQAENPLSSEELQEAVPSFSESEISFVVAVFEELQLVVGHPGGWQIVSNPTKRSLTEASIYQRRVKEIDDLHNLYHAIEKMNPLEFADWMSAQVG